MILPEDNIVTKRPEIGYAALYDTVDDSMIGQGVVLVCDEGDKRFLFTVGKSFNVFETTEIKVEKGSIFEVTTGTNMYALTKFDIETCRFPTQEELDLYNTKVDTI